jgi:glyoxylase-like metal-dependent hydrolase (beta-lactamase superfamily II)
MPVWSCAACAVEYPDTAAPPARCPICEDERQYVPRSGQSWISLDELSRTGHTLVVGDVEPGLWGVSTSPRVGIGQRALLLQTAAGNLLWDPTGFVDEASAELVRGLGGVAVIAASHPHMFGAQLEWSRLFGGAPVLVAEADREWLQRPGPAIRFWTGTEEVLPGVTLRVVGGHFPGSAVAYWDAGAGGRGVVLSGDTIFPTPDGKWATFMRSYPNTIPLSAAVVDRVATAVTDRPFERLYGNFGGVIDADARAAVRRSADRYMAWVSGANDHLT